MPKHKKAKKKRMAVQFYQLFFFFIFGSWCKGKNPRDFAS
jgi:hypothetical protein